MISTEIWTALGGIFVAVVGGVAAYLRGQRAGRDAVERHHAQERVTGAQERANADRDASRSDDPVAELRRDWRRGL